jgi:hypothetical protein
LTVKVSFSEFSLFRMRNVGPRRVETER